MKKASVLIESLLVFVVLLTSLFIALPFIAKTNQRERYIVLWNQKFSNIQYAYSVLKVQMEDENTNFMSSSFQRKLRQFLREKNIVTGNYKPQFLNKNIQNETYIFNKYFENENGLVLGFKWINPKCKGHELCAVMSVDINGLEKPNVWGRDIYGVNFYLEDVEPAGRGLSINTLLKDCSKKGSGVYCSAYYLNGGFIGK